nr:hypothetical protein GCM10025730_20150 [Promicromonospora thailandica]
MPAIEAATMRRISDRSSGAGVCCADMLLLLGVDSDTREARGRWARLATDDVPECSRPRCAQQ